MPSADPPAGPVDLLARAAAQAEPLIAAVQEDDWSLPTPCAGWTVADLVGHLIGGDRMFAAVLDGDAEAPAPRPDPEELRRDPGGAYRAAAADLLAACRRPGALGRNFTVPAGAVPGAVAVQLRLVETLVHGWDLAQATGRSAPFADDLAEQALGFTREALTRLPGVAQRRPFGPPQPVPDDAPPLDRLAALLGRTVPGTAPSDAR